MSLRERDGETWIVAKGRLFSFYAPELVGKIVRTGRMDVSAETEVRGEIGHDGDVEVYRDWIGIGVTILGDDVDPAVPGARIAALSSMEGEFQELKLRAAALRSGTTEKTKKGVENHMNKQAIAGFPPSLKDTGSLRCRKTGRRWAWWTKAARPTATALPRIPARSSRRNRLPPNGCSP